MNKVKVGFGILAFGLLFLWWILEGLKQWHF